MHANVKQYEIRAEENYAPQPQIESASLPTILYCVTIIQAEIHQFMHKHNFGLTLKLQSAAVTLNIRSRSSRSDNSFLSPKNVNSFLCDPEY